MRGAENILSVGRMCMIYGQSKDGSDFNVVANSLLLLPFRGNVSVPFSELKWTCDGFDRVPQMSWLLRQIIKSVWFPSSALDVSSQSPRSIWKLSLP